MSKPRYFVIADAHGEFDKLQALLKLIEEKASFSLANGDHLVQLGDRNDRGPDTFEINDLLHKLSLMYPNQVHVLMGNHDRMLIDAAQGNSDLMYWNGGSKTLTSYCRQIGRYGKGHLREALQKVGHFDWLSQRPLFHETEDYFFSHAPISIPHYRTIDEDTDFRTDEHTLTWTYVHGVPEDQWVDPNPVPIERDGNFYPGEGKLCLHGHIHGIYAAWVKEKVESTDENGNKQVVEYTVKKPIIPGVRKYGNSILLDTGSGCTEEGYLTCVELPSLDVYNSKGEVTNILVIEEQQRLAKEKEQVEEAKRAEERKNKPKPDNNF